MVFVSELWGLVDESGRLLVAFPFQEDAVDCIACLGPDGNGLRVQAVHSGDAWIAYIVERD